MEKIPEVVLIRCVLLLSCPALLCCRFFPAHDRGKTQVFIFCLVEYSILFKEKQWRENFVKDRENKHVAEKINQ